MYKENAPFSWCIIWGRVDCIKLDRGGVDDLKLGFFRIQVFKLGF